MNRHERRKQASSGPHLRVRVGIGFREDGTYVASVLITGSSGVDELWESEPYATEAEAERHRARISAGVREILTGRNPSAVRVLELLRGSDAEN